MTDTSICAAVQCHYLPDSAETCAMRMCPFADERREPPEDPEPEEEDDVLVWNMGDDQAAHGALKALAGLCGPIVCDARHRGAGGRSCT
jgi:hypothetical protein